MQMLWNKGTLICLILSPCAWRQRNILQSCEKDYLHITSVTKFFLIWQCYCMSYVSYVFCTFQRLLYGQEISQGARIYDTRKNL